MACAVLRLLIHSDFTAFFSPLPYLNLEDYVRLVLCDRRCFDGIVQYHLAEISYLVMCHDDWYNEALIEEYWQSDCSVVQAGYDAFEFMCLSCGVRPGASWLGHDECHECFDEH